ncbi:Rhombotin-1 [Sarcoptes scabiei]|uniref:Rhombotin-1 n=1 Tax=Sarcoptes scabiei TaxID=52283 RepID=A0A834RAB0_SARSC|nr:Rhombotin-1 [Sarcoptes scabiei]
MVMRARGNVYHLECFKCEACNHRFCVGDRFYLHDNRILCEYDYEEQMTLNQIHQQHHFGSTQTTYNHHPHNPAMPNYPQNQLYQLSSLPPGTQQPSYLQCSQFTISETEMNGKSINGCQNGTDDCPKPKI